jgi:hypothetical protein
MFGILDRSTVIMYVLLILSTLFVVNHTMFLTERHTNEGFSQTDRFVAKYDDI